ncbi:alpha/beta hydrolase [Candidatus Saccharibacteria bacterium]|nr:alpha/beta hydrolase [Candidatus Saccharibacteria bacterium]
MSSKQYDIDRIQQIIYFHPPTNPDSTKTFLLIQGLHSNQTRMHGVIEFLQDYGQVISFDLPGTGETAPLNSTGQDISLENLSEYLGKLISQIEVTNLFVVAISLGGQLITTTLLQNPELENKLDKILGLGCPLGADSFHPFDLKNPELFFFKSLLVFRYWPLINIAQRIVNSPKIKWLYRLGIKKYQDTGQRSELVELEYQLWKQDLKTHATIGHQLLTKQFLIPSNAKIEIDFINLITKDDQYIDWNKTNQLFGQYYRNYSFHFLKLANHAPSLIATKEEIKATLTKQILDIIAS